MGAHISKVKSVKCGSWRIFWKKLEKTLGSPGMFLDFLHMLTHYHGKPPVNHHLGEYVSIFVQPPEANQRIYPPTRMLARQHQDDITFFRLGKSRPKPTIAVDPSDRHLAWSMWYVWKLRWPPKNWMAPCTKMKQFQAKIMGWVPNFEVNTHGDGIDFAASWRKQRVFLLWRSNCVSLILVVFTCICGIYMKYVVVFVVSLTNYPKTSPMYDSFCNKPNISPKKFNELLVKGSMVRHAAPILGGLFTRGHDVHHRSLHIGVASGHRFHRSFPGW